MTFRRAEPPDLPILVQLVRRFHAEEGIESDEQTVTSAVTRLINDESLGRLWLFTEGDAVGGYVVLGFGYSIEFQGRDAFVDELYVEPVYRRQGWGLRALQFVEQAAAELGIRALHLEVSHSNERAASLYRRLGFRAHDRALMTKWLGRVPSAWCSESGS